LVFDEKKALALGPDVRQATVIKKKHQSRKPTTGKLSILRQIGNFIPDHLLRS